MIADLETGRARGLNFRAVHPYHAKTAFSASASPMIMMMSVIQSMEGLRRALLESWVLIGVSCRA